jgi:MerR family transcriptional regulator/heat shock protein HspR
MKNRESDASQPRYVISVAAEILGTQPYTLRYYERVGIIKPARSHGNLRMYSEADLALLRRIMTLMYDLGVNLAGIDVILRMNQQIIDLQRAAEALQNELNRYRQEEL